MEFVAAVNTLNMNGYIFNYITFKDILIVKDKSGKAHIKIKNLLQREINKFAIVNMGNDELPYPMNIEKSEDITYFKENISEIIDIFDNIFTKIELKNELKALKDIKKIFSEVSTINNF